MGMSVSGYIVYGFVLDGDEVYELSSQNEDDYDEFDFEDIYARFLGWDGEGYSWGFLREFKEKNSLRLADVYYPYSYDTEDRIIGIELATSYDGQGKFNPDDLKVLAVERNHLRLLQDHLKSTAEQNFYLISTVGF